MTIDRSVKLLTIVIDIVRGFPYRGRLRRLIDAPAVTLVIVFLAVTYKKGAILLRGLDLRRGRCFQVLQPSLPQVKHLSEALGDDEGSQRSWRCSRRG